MVLKHRARIPYESAAGCRCSLATAFTRTVLLIVSLTLGQIAFGNPECEVHLPGLAMAFVWIPPGTYTCGLTEADAPRLRVTDRWHKHARQGQPAHEVTVIASYKPSKRQREASVFPGECQSAYT